MYSAKGRAYTKRCAEINKEWWTIRSMMGCANWAIFYIVIGGRDTGKSYDVCRFFVNQWRLYKRPFTWMRLTDASAGKLLNNNAEKLIDPDLRRRFNLDLTTRSGNVYEVTKRRADGRTLKKERMARVLALSTFYNDKGSGLFDKDFLDNPDMYYNIVLDEMNREKNEKKTFDIVYAFVNQLENIVRHTKQRVRVVMIGNTLEEASDLLTCFNFIPEKFGTYKLKKKRAVIHYMPESEKMRSRRQGTIADLLTPTASTFTNAMDVDTTLVTKKRLLRPNYVIMFTKDVKFTVWDNNVVSEFHNEKVPYVAMRPYLDVVYNTDRMNTVISLFDSRSYLFRNLITQKKMKKELELLKPRSG